MTWNPKHGGRRKNQTGRPRHTVQKTEQVKARFTPEEAQRLDLLRQPNESRAACVRRLVMEIIRMKEQEMMTIFPPGRYLVWENDEDEERGHIVDEVQLSRIYYSGNWHRTNYREIDESVASDGDY